MADNTTLDSGSGGDTIRTDDISGVKWPCDKIAFGADGSATLVDGSGNGLPILLKNSSGTEIGTNAAPVQVGDGGGALTVDGTVAATQSGTWTVTGTGGTFPVTDSGGSLTVDGTVAVSGTVAVTQSGTWDEVGINDSGNSITVDDGGSSLTVDGSVTATLGAGTAYAGKVRLTDGTTDTDIRDLANSNALNVAIVDGSGDQITSFGGGTQYTEDAAAAADPVGTANILVRADTPATLTSTNGDNVAQRGTNYGAAYVQIVSSSGSFVDSFGGGTQYTEGDTDASITGTAMLWEDTSDTLRAVSAAKPLPVGDAGGALTVDNAGTFVVQVDGTALTRLTDIETNTDSGAVVGNGAAATAQRVTLANDSTGIVALTTSTASIGKLAANSGVDIGDVDVTSVIPGTGATNLGKAIDSVVGATDTGIALLAKHQEDNVQLNSSDGDYDVLHSDSRGNLRVNVESDHIFDSFNATTGWTVLGDDTLNLATTTKHISGTAALTFDKVNGAGNTIFAGIQKTLSSVNLGAVSPHDLLQGSFYIPDLANVDYVFLRLGTDASNYNEWRLPDTALTGATFLTGAQAIGDANYAGITGNGWNTAAITYIAVGVAFDNQTDALAGIVFDEVSYHTNQHTSTTFSAEVSSSVSTPNVNVSRVGNSLTATGSGVVSAGTQRVTLATDVALPSGDNNIGNVDIVTVPAPLSTTGGGTEATALRVTIASDSTGVLSIDDNGGAITVDGTVAVSGTVAVTQSGTWDEVGINDSGNSITVDNGGTFAVQSADRNGVILRPTITTSASPDYSANDVVSGIVTLSSVMSASGRQAVLKSLVVKDASGQAPALSFMFFRATPSGGTYTDNSALVWGTNDLSNMTGVVRVLSTDWYTLVSKSLAAFGGLDQLMGSANSDLYMLIVADATWNAASTSDLTVELAFEQR